MYVHEAGSMWIDPGSDKASSCYRVLPIYFCVSQTDTHTYDHLQPPRVPHVSNAAPARNLAQPVAAVAGVLGLESAEVAVTQSLVTRGLRAFGPAKHRRSRRQALINGYTLLSS